MNDTRLHANVERFSGFADTYDSFRPQPPVVICDLLTQIAGMQTPWLVVDLGSGTGLSTRIWAGRAGRVIGIEPNPDMRAEAESRTDDAAISYQEGASSETELPNDCADIVTVSQAFHWMDPQPTLAEVARILRPGGVFAAFDCDWPPAMPWEAQSAWRELMTRAKELQKEHRAFNDVRHWSKEEHLTNIRESGLFRFVQEACVHSVEQGSADRLAGLVLSFGSIETLLKCGVTPEEIGLPEFRAEAERVLGDDLSPWYFTYRIRLGVK